MSEPSTSAPRTDRPAVPGVAVPTRRDTAPATPRTGSTLIATAFPSAEPLRSEQFAVALRVEALHRAQHPSRLDRLRVTQPRQQILDRVIREQAVEVVCFKAPPAQRRYRRDRQLGESRCIASRVAPSRAASSRRPPAREVSNASTVQSLPFFWAQRGRSTARRRAVRRLRVVPSRSFERGRQPLDETWGADRSPVRALATLSQPSAHSQPQIVLGRLELRLFCNAPGLRTSSRST